MTGFPFAMMGHMPHLAAPSGVQPVNAAAPAGGVEARFQQAMDRSQPANPAQPVAPVANIGPAQPAGAVPASGAVADMAARNRARIGLDLPGRSEGGDAILGGLQRLRGLFDDRHRQVSGPMAGQVADSERLMVLQMEVANYTLMVDVSSKLAGKSTQALETLMKGQ